MSKLPKIIAIVGPTAAGKSNLAIKLAKRFRGEIISADSRQIYRGMDLGTAKPKLRAGGKWQVASGVVHHLIDIKNPGEEYTAAEYKRDAIKAIRGILRRGKLPILAGGTGLYLKAVAENLKMPKVKPDLKLRKKLELRIKNEGLDSLVKELLKRDQEAIYAIDLKNPRRVVRALEVAIKSGKPFTLQRKKGKKLFDVLAIGIKLPPKKLRERINRRADKMIKAGLVKEVRQLLNKYGRLELFTNTIGYKEIINYLDGKITLEDAARQIKANTWSYARRQMTWWRKDKNIYWIKAGEENKAFNLIKNFLKQK